jgi:hypothetical protein
MLTMPRISDFTVSEGPARAGEESAERVCVDSVTRRGMRERGRLVSR